MVHVLKSFRAMIRVRKRVPFFVKKRWRSFFKMDTCSLSSESDRPPRTNYTFYGLPPGMEGGGVCMCVVAEPWGPFLLIKGVGG